MSFIRASDACVEPEPGSPHVLVGPESGASRIWFLRSAVRADDGPGLHRHAGDEAFRVVRGEVLLIVAEERWVARPGDMVVVPAGTVHTFRGLTDGVMEAMGERGMGEWVVVLDRDGTRREVEVYERDHLWRREPPPGIPPNTAEERRALYATTDPLVRAP